MKFFGFFMALILESQACIPGKVVIYTTCRDSSPFFNNIISSLEGVGNLFEDYRIIIYENNSEDDTPSLLYRWKRKNHKVVPIVEFISKAEYERSVINRIDGQFSEIEKKSLINNKALMTALTNTFNSFSYVICVDLDVHLPCLEEIIATFEKKDNWDAVFAYKIDRNGNFNDWEAFRDVKYPLGPELLGEEWSKVEKKFVLSENDPWHPVYSAFGGFAIYKREVLEGSLYKATITPEFEIAMKKWIFADINCDNQLIKEYLKNLKSKKKLMITRPHPYLPQIEDPYADIIISHGSCPLIWKMHSGAYQYPLVCYHVYLHSLIYAHGHKNFFINPRLVCVERDNHYEFHPSLDGF